jgi:hypothetical protein
VGVFLYFGSLWDEMLTGTVMCKNGEGGGGGDFPS